MAQRSKWKGWIHVSDIQPDLLEKFRKYKERVAYYRNNIPFNGFGTGNSFEAYQKARKDVPLSEREKEILSRITPNDWWEKEIAEG